MFLAMACQRCMQASKDKGGLLGSGFGTGKPPLILTCHWSKEGMWTSEKSGHKDENFAQRRSCGKNKGTGKMNN